MLNAHKKTKTKKEAPRAVLYSPCVCVCVCACVFFFFFFFLCSLSSSLSLSLSLSFSALLIFLFFVVPLRFFGASGRNMERKVPVDIKVH